MTKLYFVRHGLTVNNTKHVFNGANANPELLPTGREQARKVGAYLQQIPFTAAYASPQIRALETAELILNENQYPTPSIQQDPLLKEIDFGAWDEVSIDQLANHPELENLRHHPEKYNPSEFGGESYAAVISRGQQFMESLPYEEGHYLIVGHGVTLTTLLQTLRQKEIAQIREDGLLDNTSITTFETVDGQSFELIDWNYCIPSSEL